MIIKIYSPEKVIFEGKVKEVAVPGYKKPFVVLKGHAPIVSVLSDGIVAYTTDKGKENKINIKDGLLEIRKDVITLCVEVKTEGENL